MLEIHKIPFGSAIKSKTTITGWRTKGKFYTRLPSLQYDFFYYADDNTRCLSNSDTGWDFADIVDDYNGWNKICEFYWQRILFGKVFEIKYNSGEKSFGIYLTGILIEEDEELSVLVQRFELKKELFK